MSHDEGQTSADRATTLTCRAGLAGRHASSPKDVRRPSLPSVTSALGEGGSLVPGPSLRAGNSSGRGCTGRAGSRSHLRRRFERCQSCAPAARSSGRDAYPPVGPPCLSCPLPRASQTLPLATSQPRTWSPKKHVQASRSMGSAGLAEHRRWCRFRKERPWPATLRASSTPCASWRD